MSRGTRWLLALLVLAAARPVAAQEPERLRLDYDIEFTGFTVATLDIDIGLGERSFVVNTYIATTGLFSTLYPMTVRARTEGRVNAGLPLAERHRSETRGRSGIRVVEASYRDGRLVALQRTVNPPEPQPESQVPEAERRASSDPATAILAVVQGVMLGRGCAQRIVTYDGRRLHAATFSDAGNARPPSGVPRALASTAISCNFVFQSSDGVAPISPPRQGRAWIGRVSPTAMAPLRVELETRWGTVVVRLRDRRGVDAGIVPPG